MIKTLFFIALLLLPVSPGVQANELKIIPGSKCLECGMICMLDSSFTSAMVDPKGHISSFCDVGDLFVYQKNTGKGRAKGQRYVRDFQSLKWLTVERAFFVKNSSLNSPMGWGIAAFSSKKAASQYGKVLSGEEVMGLLP